MKRFEVWLVTLDPTLGAEMRKTRPAVIVSPDELNAKLSTVIAAPLTSSYRPWPWRVEVRFQEKDGQVALDQMRSLSRRRFRKRLGNLQPNEGREVLDTLTKLFSP